MNAQRAIAKRKIRARTSVDGSNERFISLPLQPWRSTALQCGNHVGDGVGEIDTAVEIGLPVLGEDAQIVFPASFVEAFADGVGDVT